MLNHGLLLKEKAGYLCEVFTPIASFALGFTLANPHLLGCGKLLAKVAQSYFARCLSQYSYSQNLEDIYIFDDLEHIYANSLLNARCRSGAVPIIPSIVARVLRKTP